MLIKLSGLYYGVVSLFFVSLSEENYSKDMSTVLFHEIVFGPIRSRRLGVSLGVNLLPLDGKWCSYDCIYCECGYNADNRDDRKIYSREEVRAALHTKLLQMQQEGSPLDVITFAGNGEPTLHPEFEGIIDDTIALRNELYPSAHITVLTNSTRLEDEGVFRALCKVDNNCLKLDTMVADTMRLLNVPAGHCDPERVVRAIEKFEGKCIVQTMFTRGEHDGKRVDNTTEEEISLWLDAIARIRPRQVQIYSIDRKTPEQRLEKVPVEELQAIGERVKALGIDINVAG